MPATKEVDLWGAARRTHVPRDAHKATSGLEHTTSHITANGLMPVAEPPVPFTRAPQVPLFGDVASRIPAQQHHQQYVHRKT